VTKDLSELLSKQRWFGAKSRTITGVESLDVAKLPGSQTLLHLVSVNYAAGPADTYFLPLLGETDALTDEAACAALLALIENETQLPTQHGCIQGRRSSYRPKHASVPSRLVRSEQSNSSIIFGDLLILKLFRRQQPGENPDCELSRYLTEHTSFRHIPPFAGSIEYTREGEEPYTLGMLQGLVANESDGWNWTLQHLDAALPAARTLGQLTADMHSALATYNPEPLEPADLQQLADEMTAHAQLAPNVPLNAVKQFERLRHINPHSQRIRIHGDYHLGQTLRVPNDWILLDFEGEPTKSLAERRAKHCPLKDVAGMLRSFSYASYTAWPDAALEARRNAWEQTVSNEFLQAYRQQAGNAAFLPADQNDFTTLLDAYVLDKALYELNYEINNRPGWVRIPLAAISASHGKDLP
jgi:maltose alpha-D-glucosyltransferase / alpha-amylase